jgi:hypothetical protein
METGIVKWEEWCVRLRLAGEVKTNRLQLQTTAMMKRNPQSNGREAARHNAARDFY